MENEAAEVLLQSETGFRALIEHAPVAIFVSREGVVAYANPACVRLFGAESAEQIVGRSSLELFDPAILPQVRERIRQLRTTWKPAPTAQERIVRLDGAMVDVEVAAAPFADRGVQAVHVVLMDISERKRASDALREVEASFERVFQSSPVMLAITVVEDGSVLEVNDAFLRVSGYAREEVVERTSTSLGWIEPGQRQELLERLLAGEHLADVPLTLRSKVGERIDALYSGELIQFRGQPRILSAWRDITAQRQLEEQLRQSQKIEAVGQLAAGVAHDFNNILAAELMQIGLLQMDPSLGAPARQALAQIEKMVRRGAGLTKQLLTFSRAHEAELHPLDVVQTLTGSTEMLRHLLGETVNLRFRVGGAEIPLVNGDTGLLEQMVVNLCVNARDAMPQGGELTLGIGVEDIAPERARRRQGISAGRHVRIDVSDTGCGMDERTAERVFEPFFTTKPIGKGTGLGLSVVYGIVKQHGGWVEIDTAPGQGTTFRVYLPPAPAAAVETARRTETAALPRGTEVVLLVEDEDAVRIGISKALRHYGYQVIEAVDGPDALARWSQSRGTIAAVLTDLAMPGGMTGMALIETLRREDGALKAILCTGYNDDGDALGDNGIRVLRKPFNHVELLGTLRAVLDDPGAAQPPSPLPSGAPRG